MLIYDPSAPRRDGSGDHNIGHPLGEYPDGPTLPAYVPLERPPQTPPPNNAVATPTSHRSVSRGTRTPQVEIQEESIQPPTPVQEVLPHVHRFYYKLYSSLSSGPMPSLNPVDLACPELSFFCAEHIGPPCLWQQVLDHICARENFESKGVKMFYRNPTVDEEAPLLAPFSWQSDGCGSRENPLQIRAPYGMSRDVEMRGHRERPNFTGLVQDLRGFVGTTLQRSVWTEGNHFFAERNAMANPQSIHYRLFWPGGKVPMSSRLPLFRSDPSLSRISNDNVSPPRLTTQYIEHIGNLENINPARLKCYRLAKRPTARTITGGITEIPKDAALFVDFGGERRFTEEDPLYICVDVDMMRETGEPDREVASFPLPMGVRAGRSTAKASMYVGKGMWAILLFMLKMAYQAMLRCFK